LPPEGGGHVNRTLSYSECGNLDSGMPVIFCYGLMSSSIAIMFAHHHALRNNLRMIAIDYPGIGESSTFSVEEEEEERSLAEWGDDLTYFCDTVLGQDAKVRLLGHSLGGLHVLALLSHSKFKKKVLRTILLCPWLYLDGEEFNPMWIRLTHGLPSVVQSRIIPTLLTGLSFGTVNLATWSRPTQFSVQAAKLVTDYCFLQGPKGSQQMVQLALSKCETYLPHDLPDSPIVIYHGRQDQLVLEKSTQELTRLLNERHCQATHIILDDCDHNSVLSCRDNLRRIMSKLVGDDDTSWAFEIINSLSPDEQVQVAENNDDDDGTMVIPTTPARRARSMPNNNTTSTNPFDSEKTNKESDGDDRRYDTIFTTRSEQR